MLECVCHVRPTHPYWEDLEGLSFTSTVINKFIRGDAESLKSCMITVVCKPGLALRTAVTEFGKLNAMGIIGSQDGKGQVAALNCQMQDNHAYYNG